MLDGNITEYAFCSKCEAFIPKSVVMKVDYNHRCLHQERKGYYLGTKFNSKNLKSVPATNVGPRSKKIKGRNYECLLCGDKFPSMHCKYMIKYTNCKDSLCVPIKAVVVLLICDPI